MGFTADVKFSHSVHVWYAGNEKYGCLVVAPEGGPLKLLNKNNDLCSCRLGEVSEAIEAAGSLVFALCLTGCGGFVKKKTHRVWTMRQVYHVYVWINE